MEEVAQEGRLRGYQWHQLHGIDKIGSADHHERTMINGVICATRYEGVVGAGGGEDLSDGRVQPCASREFRLKDIPCAFAVRRSIDMLCMNATTIVLSMTTTSSVVMSEAALLLRRLMVHVPR